MYRTGKDKFTKGTTRVHHCKFTKASDERLYKIMRVNHLYRQGCSFSQIAERIGLSSSKIAREYYFGSDNVYNRNGKTIRGVRQVILGAFCKL